MPVIHFGGGTVGEGACATVEDVGGLLETLAACGITEIDTAGVYPTSAPGASERLLGAVKAFDRGFTINTKIMVTGHGPGQGSLIKEAIDESVQRSLTVLGVPNVIFPGMLFYEAMLLTTMTPKLTGCADKCAVLPYPRYSNVRG